jgi:hypothetical protein
MLRQTGSTRNLYLQILTIVKKGEDYDLDFSDPISSNLLGQEPNVKSLQPVTDDATGLYPWG